MRDLIIVGAGGFAREVAWLVERINNIHPTWNLLGFFDEFHVDKNHLNGYPLLDDIEMNAHKETSFYIVAIGDSETRSKVVDKIGNVKFATLIDPSVYINNTISIGIGSIICAGSIITVNVVIGKHAIINLDCTLGHDAIIEDFVTLLPSVNVSGHVVVKDHTSIGTGSQIIQEKTVGSHTIVGAGSVVVKDISDYVVAVAIPANEIKKRK